MTTTSCPTWAQDCHDCGRSIPGGTWRQYVDGVGLAVRHVNGCPPGRHSTGIHVTNLGAVVDRRGDFPGCHRHRADPT